MESTDPARLEAELLARIADDPASDAPRHVLADFYVQRGDPRGELMALQLGTPTGPHKTRLKTLVRELRREIAGPLVEVLEEKSIRIARGRLFACKTKFANNDQRRAVRGNLLWATVEELVTDDAALVGDSAMRALRVVEGLNIDSLAAVCRTARASPIEKLVLHLTSPSQGTLDDRALIGESTAALPKLRVVELAYLATAERIAAGRLAWLLESPLGKQLEEVTIRGQHARRWDFPLWIEKDSFLAYRRPGLRFRFP